MLLPPPPAITQKNQPPVFIVESSDFHLYTLPLENITPISGFVSDEGKVHFEINRNAYQVSKRKEFWQWLKSPRSFYQNLPTNLIRGSLLGDQRRPVAGGQGYYDPKKRHFCLQNVGILHRRLAPNVDPTIRKKAIFLFQEAFDQLVPWLGGQEAISWTIIPNDKMQALGWSYQGRGSSLWAYLKYLWQLFPMTILVHPRFYTKSLLPTPVVPKQHSVD
jgi:hypothetical protein